MKGICVEERFGSKSGIVFGVVYSAHPACSSGKIDGGIDDGVKEQIDPSHHDDLKEGVQSQR